MKLTITLQVSICAYLAIFHCPVICKFLLILVLLLKVVGLI